MENREADYFTVNKMKEAESPLFFYSITNMVSAMRLNQALLKLIKEEGNTITIRFVSYGGPTFGGIAMYNGIKEASRNCKIIGINDGMVGSAAILPFLACTTRMTRKDSLFLIHEGSVKIKESLTESEIRNENKKMEVRTKLYGNIVLAETNMPQEVYDAYKSNDSFITPTELEEYFSLEYV